MTKSSIGVWYLASDALVQASLVYQRSNAIHGIVLMLIKGRTLITTNASKNLVLVYHCQPKYYKYSSVTDLLYSHYARCVSRHRLTHRLWWVMVIQLKTWTLGNTNPSVWFISRAITLGYVLARRSMWLVLVTRVR